MSICLSWQLMYDLSRLGEGNEKDGKQAEPLVVSEGAISQLYDTVNSIDMLCQI